jgi:hypothetical protein
VVRHDSDEFSTPGLVVDFANVDGDWFVLDLDGKMVFHYGPEGTFLGPIGRRGEGPGEFGRATALYSWNDRLLIVDSARGQYLAYSVEGVFERRISSGNLWIHSRKIVPLQDDFYVLGLDMESVRTESDYWALAGKKFRHAQFLQVDDWVIAYFSRGNREYVATVFDTEGNLLRANIPLGRKIAGLGGKAFGNQIVNNLRAGDMPPETLPELLCERGLQMLYDSGFEGTEDEAVYLLFSQIRKPSP